jgi:hypothetical protein
MRVGELFVITVAAVLLPTVVGGGAAAPKKKKKKKKIKKIKKKKKKKKKKGNMVKVHEPNPPRCRSVHGPQQLKRGRRIFANTNVTGLKTMIPWRILRILRILGNDQNTNKNPHALFK